MVVNMFINSKSGQKCRDSIVKVFINGAIIDQQIVTFPSINISSDQKSSTWVSNLRTGNKIVEKLVKWPISSSAVQNCIKPV